ncbi:unnamed protein product [Ilex paraguariensis]|uniref:Pentatricopeptide repeat-containing protein n=1 Tax=Ilex paraguariensis TaxID=185542 RepID=A0ABC8U681_9AQUA
MDRSGLQPNEFGFSVALKACRTMHDFVMGDVKNAQKFFEGILLCRSSEALWNKLLDGYAQTCDVEEAFRLFHRMAYSSSSPNIKIMLQVGFEGVTFECEALADTYGKFGLLADACNLFWNLEERDNVAWCALLAGFLQNGEAEQGLNLFIEFLSDGAKPDPFSFAIVFSLCAKSDIEGIGPQVHCSFIKYGFALDSFLGSALIDMYENSGIIWDAYMCFTEVKNKNQICFSAMINNLVFCSINEMTLELFCQMMKLELAPRIPSLSYIVRACADLLMLREGKSLHAYVLKNFNDSDSYSCIENALIELYAECGVVDDAKMVFKVMTMPNEFSWTTVILGCCQMGRFSEALRQCSDMFFAPVIAKLSHFTVVPILQA